MEKKIRGKGGHTVAPTNKDKKNVRFPDVVRKVIVAIQPSHEKKVEVSLTRGRVKSLLEVVHSNFSNFFYQNMYILTNISMMIWSILFHSFPGFILLLWVNVIWIKSNKRETMMKSSPFLVTYAAFLLLISYFDGIKFSYDELPSFMNNVRSIGLKEYRDYVVVHLFLKTVLMVPLLMTMRLRCQERLIMEHKKTLRFEEAVLHLAQEKDESRNLTIHLLRKIFLFTLMWIIVFTLFLIAVHGDKMTLFRIINMCFFLTFILLFQLCFKAWLKAMGVFWYCLIIYSMATLVLIYAYQFKRFPELSWQAEIGLQKYETRKLGIILFSFTFVMILTGLQMNHLHSEFLKLFDESGESSVRSDEESSTDERIPMVRQISN